MEHQEGEVDNELHITNTMLVYDAALSSNDSCYAQIVDYCSEEALCLDIDFGIVNIDELEIESCHTNMQGKEWHEYSSKDEPIKGDELQEEVTSPFPC